MSASHDHATHDHAGHDHAIHDHAGHDHGDHGGGFVPGLGHHRLTPLYDLVQRLFGIPRAHRRLLDLAAVAPGERVLEIGCGTGNLALAAQRRQPSATVVAIDPDEVAVARARRKAARAGLPVRVEVGYAERLPQPDGDVDVVLASLMLHHLDAEGRRRAVHEARRVLAPGGRLVVLDFDGGHGRRRGLLGPLLGRVARVGPDFVEEVTGLMRDAGLTAPTVVARLSVPIVGALAVLRATAGSETPDGLGTGRGETGR